MSRAIAIDLGGSSGRVMLVTLSVGILHLDNIHRFDNKIIEKEDHLFWDIEYLESEIFKGLDKIKFQKGDSISVDTWGVDYVLIDNSGKSLNPFHYRDSRSVESFNSAVEKLGRESLYKESGLQMMNINTLFQLMSEEQCLEGKTLLFMPDYFLYKLCGEKNTEISIASTSQMLNPITKEWNNSLLSNLLPSRPLLMPVNKSGIRLGYYVKNKGIDVISGCGHDTQAALVAVPSDEKDFLFLSSGTWSLFGTELDEPILTKDALECDLTNEIGFGNKIAFLKNIIGLWIVQQLKREWNISYDEMETLAKNSTPFKAFIDLEDSSFVAPGPMERRIKEYVKKTEQSELITKGEIVRTVFESLALKYREAKEQIERCTNKQYSTLYMVGGGCKSPLLSEFTASALGLQVIKGPVEATVYGNALIQFITKGELKGLEEARALTRALGEIKEVKGCDTELWDQAYIKYLKIVKG